MKRIIITEKQLKDFVKLEETVQQYVNKKPGETLDSAIKNAAREVAVDAPNADVDFVISKDEVNEDVNGDTSVVDKVTQFIINNWSEDLEDNMLTVSAVKDMIQDAYIEVTGEDIDFNDKNIYREIMYKISNYISSNKTPKVECIKVTKKQIKEAQKNKRIAESKVISKSDFMKSLK